VPTRGTRSIGVLSAAILITAGACGDGDSGGDGDGGDYWDGQGDIDYSGRAIVTADGLLTEEAAEELERCGFEGEVQRGPAGLEFTRDPSFEPPEGKMVSIKQQELGTGYFEIECVFVGISETPTAG